MPAISQRGRALFAEAARRGVSRAAAWYAGVAFVVWQVADIALPALGAADWVMSVVVIAAIVGSPVVLVIAWIYDFRDGRFSKTLPGTPEPTGALRTDPGWSPAPLPEPLTPFVGRAAEVDAVVELVQESGHRLISIVAPGGMGKSRLVLRAARFLEDRFPDGIAYVALEGVTGAEGLASELGRALGLRREDSADPMALVRFFLAHRSMLLILDGFEGVANSPEHVSAILEASRGTSILLTSRVGLSVRAEVVYRLEGMRCVSEDDGPTDGVALYRQVATRRNRSGASQGPKDQLIEQICALVDGSPLGIELAASWSGAMSVEDLMADLEAGGEFLEARDQDVPERQRSLGVVLDSTWRRLDRTDREALSELAIFEGAFGPTDVSVVAPNATSALGRLEERSCVQARSDGRSALPRTMRQCVRSHTREWPPASLAESHGLHVSGRMGFLAAGLRSTEHDANLAALEAMLPDIERAWRSACERQDTDLLRTMLQPLRKTLEASGRVATATELFSVAVELCAAAPPPDSPDRARLRGQLLSVLGHFQRLAGDIGAAVQHMHDSLEILKPLGRTKELAFAMNGLGDLSTVLGRYPEAKQFCERARSIFVEIGDGLGIAASANNLGVVAHRLREMEEARSSYIESLEACERLGDRHGSGYALNNLGVLYQETEMEDRARDSYERAIEVGRAVGDRYGEAAALSNLARVDLKAGRTDEATDRTANARVIFDEMGDGLGVCVCDLTQGDIALARGDLVGAEGAYRLALVSGTEWEAQPLLGEALIGIADVWVRRGEPARAASVLASTLDCSAVDRDAALRRDTLWASLDSEITEGAYDPPALRDVARAVLSQPSGD